jgi:hypothetical protein
VQYPNEQPPEVVYPCSKWEALDFGGAFFRSSGGNAQQFDNQTAAQSEGTAKNGLSVSTTNTLKLRDANNDTGTENTTSSMSDNSTGFVNNIFNGFVSGAEGSGNVSITPNSIRGSVAAGSMNSWGTLKINVAHTHNIYLLGSVSTSLSSTDTETRPINYTIQIWKRTA